MSRRLAREELFKIVFESEINGKDLNTVLASYLEREKDTELNEKSKEFLVKYAKGIIANNEKIHAELDEKMEGWSFERVGNVEKALLKIAVYEILCEDTPKEIVINEAVELAKKYGDVKTFEFVNGVLAKLV